MNRTSSEVARNGKTVTLPHSSLQCRLFTLTLTATSAANKVIR